MLVLTASLPAYANGASCCACVIEDHDSAVPALFCFSGNEREMIAASERCKETPDAAFLCLAAAEESPSVSPECVELLREENIICPGVSAVPALGIPALVVVAGLLSLLGAMTLRRRSVRKTASES